ncbi:MAG: hypothetical protein LQ343_002340 [Gyalolechia ehrenbergii]|nr:MAG: hypothetical protein LQ343_002340 [Gyalolechia ehrenbergii]
MVLETSAVSDSFDPFPDSPDPYGNDPQSSTNYTIVDRTQLPKPLPLIGRIFGFTEAKMSEWTAQRLRYQSSLVGRSLTPREYEAIMYHSYKNMAIQSYGLPIAFGFGVYRAFKTREDYRFPFYGPLKTADGWWDGERIRIMGTDMLEGPTARRMVHFWRGSIYSFIALLVGGGLVTSYATTVAMVGEMRDPRLKEIQRTKVERGMQQRKEAAAKKPPKDAMEQGNTNAGDLLKRHQGGIGAQDDDASPSAGSEYYGEDMDKIGGTNAAILSDAQMRTQESRQRASPRESRTENRASTFQIEKVESQPIGFGDGFADASPTAQSSTQDSQSGSAWDRIRRNAQKHGPGAKDGSRGWDNIRKEQQVGSTTGDSFTFSSADQERQLVQDEAQKEFDARVERERQGGSFNENREKKW